jgi:hypothetical protein
MYHKNNINKIIKETFIFFIKIIFSNSTIFFSTKLFFFLNNIFQFNYLCICLSGHHSFPNSFFIEYRGQVFNIFLDKGEPLH